MYRDFKHRIINKYLVKTELDTLIFKPSFLLIKQFPCLKWKYFGQFHINDGGLPGYSGLKQNQKVKS